MGAMVEPKAQELVDRIASVMHQFQVIDQHQWASQRTTADQIEHQVRERLLASDQRFLPPGGPRRPADVLWEHHARFNINIKSMDQARQFHMPNIISSENLWRILSQDQEFMILKIHHHRGEITAWEFWNIQDIDWCCLQLAALGTGQIQFRNGNAAIVAHAKDHITWRAEFRDRMLDFYQHEKLKADRRIAKWQAR